MKDELSTTLIQKYMAVALLVIAFVFQCLVLHAFLSANYQLALLFHIVTACLFPWPLLWLIPDRIVHSKLIVGLFFLLCLFIPIISGVAIFMAVTLGSRKRMQSSFFPYTVVETQSIPDNIAETVAYTRQITGNLRAILNSSSEDLQRIRAVLATRKMNDKVAIAILQIALLDPLDEVRLLAYAMLSGKEKKLSNAIQQKLQQLKMPDLTSIDQAITQHYIAEAYWELAYLGLEQGQARLHVLAKAHQYALAASEYFKTDADIQFLLGRIGLELGQFAESNHYFNVAQRYGISEEKLAPYRAEIAFAAGQGGKLRECIQKIQTDPVQEHVLDLAPEWL